MSDNINLEFCFKGTRTYVHGTDIYNRLLEKIQEEEGEVSKLDLSFHGVARKNLSLSTVRPALDEDIKFSCKYTNKEESRKLLYAYEFDSDISCRYEYPEADIYALSELNLENKEVTLTKNSSFSFIENIVALNKYLLETLFSKEEGKWYFTRVQMKEIDGDMSYPLKLIFRSNFNFKLVKTEVFVAEESVGFIYFSLV